MHNPPCVPQAEGAPRVRRHHIGRARPAPALGRQRPEQARDDRRRPVEDARRGGLGSKDLNIVVLANNADDGFAEALWSFVKAGGYEAWRSSDGQVRFYRFVSPKVPGFPHTTSSAIERRTPGDNDAPTPAAHSPIIGAQTSSVNRMSSPSRRMWRTRPTAPSTLTRTPASPA